MGILILGVFALVCCLGWRQRLAKVQPPFSLYQPLASSQLEQRIACYDFNGHSQIATVLWENVKQLSDTGWSEHVLVEIYLDHLSHEPDLKELSLLQEQALRFGSDLFVAMWQAEWTENSIDKARGLLEIALKTIGLNKGLTPNQEEINSCLSRFALLSPEHVFWSLLSKLVQYAFPKESLSDEGNLAKGVHQLRYLISLQQTNWLRQNCGGGARTDKELLLSYLADKNPRDSLAKWFLGGSYDYNLRESARLHNKLAFTQNGLVIPSLLTPNLKILIHFHSELILDAKGQFANILDGSENGVVNGASFNYASRNDKRHWELDVLPTKVHDPRFRKKVLNTSRYHYQSPTKLPPYFSFWRHHLWQMSYFNPKGDYAQANVSMASQVYQARKALEAELKQFQENNGYIKNK